MKVNFNWDLFTLNIITVKYNLANNIARNINKETHYPINSNTFYLGIRKNNFLHIDRIFKIVRQLFFYLFNIIFC